MVHDRSRMEVSELYSKPIIEKLVEEQHVDIVHKPSPIAPLYPSCLYDLEAVVIFGSRLGWSSRLCSGGMRHQGRTRFQAAGYSETC